MNIQLTPFMREDFKRLIDWVPSADFLLLWSGPYFTFPLDTPQLEMYYQSSQSNPPIRKIFKAVDLDSQSVIGHIELNNIDRRNNAAVLSKVLVGDQTLRGKGVGEMMVRRVLEIAFSQEHLHRIELRVFDFNKAAIHCYQKAGFQIEGHLRDYRKHIDGYWSSYLMSILETDWNHQNL